MDFALRDFAEALATIFTPCLLQRGFPKRCTAAASGSAWAQLECSSLNLSKGHEGPFVFWALMAYLALGLALSREAGGAWENALTCRWCAFLRR